MEHGALVLHLVAQEHNLEVEHVHLEMLVERNVLVLFLRLEHVEAQLSTQLWEHMERGALAPPHVVLELKLEAEHVHQEMLVELNVQVLFLRLEHVEAQLSTQ